MLIKDYILMPESFFIFSKKNLIQTIFGLVKYGGTYFLMFIDLITMGPLKKTCYT